MLDGDNGFNYSIGAKLNSGLSPYGRVSYRHNFLEGDNHHWRTRQTLFWKKDERFGVSSHLNYNYYINDRNIFDWNTEVKYTEQEQQWEWISSAAIHRSITKKRGVSSRFYLRGESDSEVSIPEYGLTFTYIRPVLRDWLIMEAGVDFRWERESISQSSYKSASRLGIQFEMLLGDYYKYHRRIKRRDK